MSPQDFLDEILKPALDLIAEEYEDTSLEYQDGQGNYLVVRIGGQDFLVNIELVK